MIARIALRRLLAAALALAAPGVIAAESAQARAQALDAGVWDDPLATEERARAALVAAQARGEAQLVHDAALQLAIAAQALEHTAEAGRAAAIARAVPGAREDVVASCLLASIPEAQEDARAAELRMIEHDLPEARRRGELWCVARLQFSIGQVMDSRGRLGPAMEALQEAQQLFEREPNEAAVASVQASLSWSFGRQEDTPEALERAIAYGRSAVATAERLRLRYLAAVAHHNLAGPYQRNGQLDEASTHLERSMALSRELGDVLGAAYVARLQARLAVLRSRPAQALLLYERAQADFAAGGQDGMALVCLIRRLQVLAELGRWADVERELPAAQALLDRAEDLEERVYFRHLAMQLREVRGDLAGALEQAKAWGAAIQDAHREENRRLAAESQERNESGRKEAENRLLRTQQTAAQSRQRLLLATLLLALALVVVLLVNGRRQRRLRASLRELAERDELTQLPNRRTVLERARQCVDEARRLQQPMAVALLDIDHFKRVNDHYGHPVGDEALKVFAGACARVLRPYDMVGRVGGEEFLFLFPGATSADLLGIFQRVRGELQRTPVPGMAPDERLTFSMGADFLQPADEVGGLIQRADEALYGAKAAGRDRLAMASQPPGRPTARATAGAPG